MTIEIKDDGKAWAVKGAPEPLGKVDLDNSCFGSDFAAWQQYESALASCERILIEDQEKAKRLIWPVGYIGERKPGITIVPNLEWEEAIKPVQVAFERWDYEKVAILKDSPIKQQEDIDVTHLKEESQYFKRLEKLQYPHREICHLCNRVVAVGFWVPNEIWAAVVHHSHLNAIHCLSCFTERADEKLINWSKDIKFYAVSLRSHLDDIHNGNDEMLPFHTPPNLTRKQ